MSIDSVAGRKSKAFARRIVRLYQYLCSEQKELVMSRQVLRCGTSIGANIAEAIYACSRKDFAAKLQIAQKEAAETLYWLDLLHTTNYLTDKMYHSLLCDCNEIMAIISATIKTTKQS